MKQTVIVGAGLSGLIAANLLKSRGFDILVYEKQTTLPDNHQAVLRFRSPALGEALGIPFKKVQAVLCLAPTSYPGQNALLHAMSYSDATTGIRRTDRSITRLLDGPKVVERWIAPPNFREILFERIKGDVRYGHSWTLDEQPFKIPVVSTIPMSVVYQMTALTPAGVAPTFRANHYSTASADALNTDAYGSIYNPRPSFDEPWTRASVTGSRVSLEISMGWDDEEPTGAQRDGSIVLLARVMLDLMGVSIDYRKDPPRVQYSASDRILPIPDRVRKGFIMHLTDKYNIYSLGRFATWRPGMLLDDIVQDVNIVASMIEGKSAYRYEAKK